MMTNEEITVDINSISVILAAFDLHISIKKPAKPKATRVFGKA
jgi:hypothetical protein